jgi:hypothetical protein
MHGRTPARAFVLAFAALLAAGVGPVPARAQSADRDVTVTVYNSNLALVKDVRTLDLGTGRKTIRVSDVSAQIDPTSVHLTPQGSAALSVLEQNFQYDVVSADRVLERYKDRELNVLGKDGRTTTGRLLSFDGANLVLDRNPGVAIVNRAEIKEIQFPELPGGLITRPTLVWFVDNAGAAQRQAQISYLTTGLSWHAEYVAVIGSDDRALSWAGWVSLENTSGTDYPEAKLKLVAGDVNRLPAPAPYAMKGRVLETAAQASDASQFQGQTFFEYHLYSLSRPTTLADKETKQLALFPTAAVTAQKLFTYDRMRHPTKVKVSMEFRNSASTGLGMPLPMGKVRVYKEDKSGAQEFVGEDQIGHTAKDETVRMTIGDAFDVVGEYRQVSTRRISEREVETSHEIKIRNRKTEKVTVKIVERQWGDWRVMEASQDHVKKDATTLEFTVDVAPDQEKVVTYTVRSK